MTRDEFKKALTDNVQFYIDNFYRFDSNPQLRINPSTRLVTLVNGSDKLTAISDNDDAIEAAAAAHGLANQDATDFQVTQNPDFYAVKPLLFNTEDGRTVPSEQGIEEIVANYY